MQEEVLVGKARLVLEVESASWYSCAKASSTVEWVVQAIDGRLAQEAMWVMALNARGNVHALVQVGQGSYSQVTAFLPAILSSVLVSGTDRFILIHNHPSGDPSPSSHDIDMTQEVADAASLVGLRLEDSVIITADPQRYTSLKSIGLYEALQDAA